MPLFWVSLSFLLGVLLAASLPLPSTTWLGLAAPALLLPFLPRLKSYISHIFPNRSLPDPNDLPPWVALPMLRISGWLKRLPPLIPYSLLPLFLFLGAARFQGAQPRLTPTSLAWYNDAAGEVELVGVLIQPPDERDTYANLRLQVEILIPLDGTEPHQVDGLLLAPVSRGSDWRYGDRLRLTGRLQTPSESETFSYRDYLARLGIYSYMSSPRVTRLESSQGNPLLSGLYTFHEHAVDTLYRIFPDPEASLLAGILLGEAQGIPPEVQASFQATGTSHIIAISGFNITLIAALFSQLFSRLLGPRRGALVAAFGIGLYVLLVGAGAAVVRAALLGWLTLLGRQIGRRQVGLNSLAFAAALMTLFNPLVLWDAGFQLSFAAALGLVLYVQPFTAAFIAWSGHWLSGETATRLARPVSDYLLTTLAAQVPLLPVIVAHFHQLPLTSLLVNPLILPAQPPIMLTGGLALVLGLVYLPLGQAAAGFAWPFTAYTIRVVELFARVPGGVIYTAAASGLFIVSYYAALFAFTFSRPKLVAVTRKLFPVGAVLVLALLAVLAWRAGFQAPDGRLHVTLLDVGSSEAVLIKGPGGRSILVNGGASVSRLSDGLGRRLPLGELQLDWLVVADPDNADLFALPTVLERYPPDNVLWAGPTGGTRAARSLWQSLSAADTPVSLMQAGQRLDLGEGASLSALAVGDRGAVLMLELAHFRLLLPLGLDFDLLEWLDDSQALSSVTVLLLAESGYAPLNPPEWIAALHPQLILLSVSAGDPENLPSPETLRTVEGFSLLRTDQNGWIDLSTDGKQMWVEVERP